MIFKTERTEKLELLSSVSKIGLQFVWLFALVILPRFFPEIIQLRYRTSLTINIILAFTAVIFYQILKFIYQRRGKDDRKIVKAELLTSVVLLSWFLHVFGRINGPFFLLYLLIIVELALNLTPGFVTLVVGIMAAATLSEFIFLVFQGEFVLNLYAGLQLFIRLVALFFMRSYGVSLAQKMVSEEEARDKVQKSAKRLEGLTRDLKTSNVKLKELSDLKDEFVSVASHELRAPMTTIKGYIAMILEGDAGNIPPKVKEFLGESYESTERMIRLINNMLNVSRIESGRLIMSLKDIQIEKAIEDVVKDFGLEAKEHGLKLEYQRPKKKLPKVRVDPDRIREVVANLVGNAINFTAHGHVFVKNNLEDGMVITEVEDTGVGISPENQKKLFKKFGQIDGAPFKKGSGLGLYICRMLITEFGGEIWLKSKAGKGTTFFFSLPAIDRSA